MKMILSFTLSLIMTGSVQIVDATPLVITQLNGGVVTVVKNGITTNAPPPVTNNIVYAASTSFEDVSNAVAAAQCGWTVQLPAGTNGWYHPLTISGITLRGSGTNSTCIRDEMPIMGGGSGNPFLYINTTNCNPTRLSMIRFNAGITNNITNFNNNNGPEIAIQGTNTNWRIDNCQFVLLSGKTLKQFGDCYGLVDHCNFLTYTRISMEIFGNGSWGDSDWATPYSYGTSNSTYMENNYFRDTVSQFCGWVDISSGGRLTFRYNDCHNFWVNTHGVETPQRPRSARYVEVYMNTFTYETNSNFQNFYAMADIRGGSGVLWSNVAYGYNAIGSLNYYRATDNDPGFTPWFGVTGLTNWDNNGAALMTVTCSVASTTALIVTNQTWVANAFVGCTVYNYSNTVIGMVTANNATNMTLLGYRHIPSVFTPGNLVTVHRVYPMLDAPGMGTGDLLADQSSHPTPVYLNEVSEPVWGWANKRYRNGSPGTIFFDGTNGAGTSYPSIVAGRDYTNAFKPGYTPFTYPHPSAN